MHPVAHPGLLAISLSIVLYTCMLSIGASAHLRAHESHGYGYDLNAVDLGLCVGSHADLSLANIREFEPAIAMRAASSTSKHQSVPCALGASCP